MDTQHQRNAAEAIVQRLVEAGMSIPFPSHQFGMVNRDKVVDLVRQQLRHYIMHLESTTGKSEPGRCIK